MEQLKRRILAEGKALNAEVLLVDSFLNHQVDVALMRDIGTDFARRFAGVGADRVVTVESSGIAPAAMTALALGLPLVVFKKQASRVLSEDVLQTTVRSFTKNTEYELTIKRTFMPAGARALLIDDFLANGDVALGVHSLLAEAGATLCGVGVVIEKAFQPGRARLASLGCEAYALARVAQMGVDGIRFAE
jgi:xanthine phosphoribosyltransferase